MKKNDRKFSFLALCLVCLMVFSLMGDVQPEKAHATSSSEIQDQIDELEKEKEELDQQIADLQSQIDDNMDQMTRLLAEKEVIDQEVALLREQEKVINTQISAYSLLIADKQEELEEAQARLQDLQQQYKARIRAMEENGQLSYWSVLFQANSFFEMLDQLEMVAEIADADRRCLEDLNAASQQVADAKAVLETEQAALQTKRAELDTLMAQLDEKRAELDELIIQIEAQGDEYEKMMEESEALQEDLMNELANMEDELEEARYREWLATSQAHGGVGGAVGGSTGDITWLVPCTYTAVTDTFGVREYHPVTGEPNKMHNGIDLAGKLGTPIVATRSGYVAVAAYQYGGAGWYVSLNHGDGYRSIYMHMTHYIVKAGQYVEAGEVIGFMGSSGGSTGVHLHFGISYNGVYKDPQNFIDFK